MPRKPVFQHRKDKERKKRLQLPSATFENVSLPLGWTYMYHKSNGEHIYCKLSQNPGSSASPMGISHTLIVRSDKSWILHVHSNIVHPNTCEALKSFPSFVSPECLSEIIMSVDHLLICAGHPDSHFIEMLRMKKGKIISSNGETAAFLDPSLGWEYRCHRHSTGAKDSGRVWVQWGTRESASKYNQHRKFS